QAYVLHRLRQMQRLGRIRRFWAAMGHVAERAAPGADLAQDHEGRGAVAEAFVDVRAAGFLAHGDQAVGAQLFLEPGDVVARGDAHPDPRRLAQHRRVGELHRRPGDLVAGALAYARLEGGDGDGLARGGAHAAIVASATRGCRPSWRASSRSSTGFTASGPAGPPRSAMATTRRPA